MSVAGLRLTRCPRPGPAESAGGARAVIVRDNGFFCRRGHGLGERGAGVSHLDYAEAGVIGLLQGITELFPISSLGHAVLIPAIVGGQWAQDLNVSAKESPYLAFIVGLHVATALAMITYFWRDWLRLIKAFFASLGHFASPEPGTRRFQPQGVDQTMIWMIILATIPVGLAGVALEHTFR